MMDESRLIVIRLFFAVRPPSPATPTMIPKPKRPPMPAPKPRQHHRPEGFREAVLRVVALVPAGRLVSYGQVAMMAGRPGAARQVGWVLHGLPRGSGIPWQRVVNTKGYVPSTGREFEAMEQIVLLRAEGVEVGDDGSMDLERYRWDGRPTVHRKNRF